MAVVPATVDSADAMVVGRLKEAAVQSTEAVRSGDSHEAPVESLIRSQVTA